LTRIDLFCYVLPGALFGAFATFKNKSLMGQAIESIGSTPSLSAEKISKETKTRKTLDFTGFFVF